VAKEVTRNRSWNERQRESGKCEKGQIVIIGWEESRREMLSGKSGEMVTGSHYRSVIVLILERTFHSAKFSEFLQKLYRSLIALVFRNVSSTFDFARPVAHLHILSQAAIWLPTPGQSRFKKLSKPRPFPRLRTRTRPPSFAS
jgi:hypothetical protein